MDAFKTSTDVFFLLIGAVMVTAMHAGFAFLEVGTVRKKNQVNALIKIFTDFCISTVAYFFIGYTIAYGIDFFAPAPVISGAAEKAPEAFGKNGYTLVKFFFLLTFAAAVPAIISGGIAERAKFWPQAIASGVIVAVFYPLFEAAVWGERFGVQKWFEATFGAKFVDFAGSIVVHCVGGWGWRWPRCCCSGRGGDATGKTAPSSAFRRRTFRSWRSARGRSLSAGSAST